jgi:hypothetical protein
LGGCEIACTDKTPTATLKMLVKEIAMKTLISIIGAVFVVGAAFAEPATELPATNLIYTDVDHSQQIQPDSENPALAAALQGSRDKSKRVRTLAPSVGAGLEYGNIEDLFDFYNKVKTTWEPSEPGEPGDGLPTPENPTSGITLDDVLDMLDPEQTALLEALASEVAKQVALLALISVEGYGKVWASGDVPLGLDNDFLGGTWTMGLGWKATSKAFGLAEPIEFDLEAARVAITDWINTLPMDRPTGFAISDDINLTPDPSNNSVIFSLNNDSSLVTKSARVTELKLGYSREAWEDQAGRLYLGAEARLLSMQLSRVAVRFGDISDSGELFQDIRNADYESDAGFSLDVGAIWLAENYQLGAQVRNLNRPEFLFPDVDLTPYQDDGVIGFLQSDKRYTMDRQLKLEASVFTADRRWTSHLRLDVDPVTDPMGDSYQWMTLSAGYNSGNWWLPNARVGLRRNLTGTELTYVGVGITAFKYLNIDIASALDTVKINGNSLPLGLMGSIGFQVHW